ncbi:hypothetical protein B0H13DRAFT_1890544 [Mycena leptocephala]|nr:hypothetical protein B0H13DRAFT_1890544 [Mycena leptocephala]
MSIRLASLRGSFTKPPVDPALLALAKRVLLPPQLLLPPRFLDDPGDSARAPQLSQPSASVRLSSIPLPVSSSPWCAFYGDSSTSLAWVRRTGNESGSKSLRRRSSAGVSICRVPVLSSGTFVARKNKNGPFYSSESGSVACRSPIGGGSASAIGEATETERTSDGTYLQTSESRYGFRYCHCDEGGGERERRGRRMLGPAVGGERERRALCARNLRPVAGGERDRRNHGPRNPSRGESAAPRAGPRGKSVFRGNRPVAPASWEGAVLARAVAEDMDGRDEDKGGSSRTYRPPAYGTGAGAVSAEFSVC